MATMAKFGSLKFEITSSTALLFQNLKLTAECETEDKDENGQQYVSAKNGKPLQAEFSIILSASLGIDVKSNVTVVLNTAQRSSQEYLYIGSTKIFPFKMMMVKAETEEIQMSPSGTWVYAKVNVTLKQCTKDWIIEPVKSESSSGGSSRSSSSTPQKASISSTTPQTTSGTTTSKKPIVVVSGMERTLVNVASAVKLAANTSATAKTVATTVSKPQPLTTEQKARASAKEGQLLGLA